MAATADSPRRTVLWFRNDLRVHDSATVHEAAQRVKAGDSNEVIPLYCFDPRQFDRTPFGNPKTGAFRAKFLLESVMALRARLRGLGSDLLIANGRPEDVLTELAASFPAKDTLVLTQREVTSEEARVDRSVQRALKGGGGRLQTLWGPTLYHVEDVPFREDLSDVPTVFTPFKQKVEARCTPRAPLPVPEQGALPLPSGLPTLQAAFEPRGIEDLNAVIPEGAPKIAAAPPPEAPAVIDFRGGEEVALARLRHYLWDTDAVATYFDTRNGMLEADQSTKFSPWLALGCLSPRIIYQEVKRYEEQRTANKSTYWVIFELIWRDYYRYFTMRWGNAIFMEYGITNRKVEWQDNAEALQRWKDGTTGLPLVDANMREMAQTGYMSNRGRQNVASYLALDLGIDWREGADWFESLLVDYDVCSNWGNWVAAAGMTGGRLNQFNIVKQSKDYDDKGDYVRKWLPELRNVPASAVHEPWRMTPADREHTGCADYPMPVAGTRYTGESNRFGASCGHSHGGGGGGGGSGRGRGRGHGRNGHRERDRGAGRGSAKGQRKSQFDMYG